MVMVDEFSCPQRRCNRCDKYRKELEERDVGCSFCSDEYDKRHKLLCESGKMGKEIFPIYANIIHAEDDGAPLLSIGISEDDIPEYCFDIIGGTSIDIMYCPICGRKLRE